MTRPFIGAICRAKETFHGYVTEGTVVIITGTTDTSWKISTLDGKGIDGRWGMDSDRWEYIPQTIYNKPARLP